MKIRELLKQALEQPYSTEFKYALPVPKGITPEEHLSREMKRKKDFEDGLPRLDASMLMNAISLVLQLDEKGYTLEDDYDSIINEISKKNLQEIPIKK